MKRRSMVGHSGGTRWVPRLGVVVVAAIALGAPACTLGDGEGEVSSDQLNVTDCWNGQFELRPDFFAASPYRRMLSIRVQNGRDTEEVSDGVTVLVDDIDRVRAHIAEHPGQPLRVGLPPSVVPPGVPITPDPDPPIVHLTLYLHRACHAQNSALYSVEGGIIFRSIFNGDVTENDDSERLTEADFTSVGVGDPREGDPVTGKVDNPSFLKGRFRFYFKRGQPAQPFP